MAFGVFGGVAFIGFVLSFGIRSRNLEEDGWHSHDDGNDTYKSDDEESS